MLKSNVLRILIDSDGYVSGQAMCTKLGVSRTAVWKAMENLRCDGFDIESKTNQGYKLSFVPDVLIEETVSPLIKTKLLGKKLICLDRVDSTNNYLKALAVEGAEEGTVVISDCQTAGKGRLGRDFQSPKGKGIYLSVLLRPEYAPSEIGALTSVVALAVAKAIENISGIKTGIKWVNDIIAGEKKVCGILTEMSVVGENAQIDYAVIGIGINVLQSIEDFSEDVLPKATSLSMLGAKVSRAEIAAAVINSLDDTLKLMPVPDETFWDEYREKSVTLGRQIKVIKGNEEKDAFAEDVDNTGALSIRFPDGKHDTLNFGEISIRGKYGYV